MTQDTPPIAAIVEGLSEAQRDRIRWSAPGERQMGGFGVIYDDRGQYRSPPLVERDGINHPIFGSHWRLTPLGQRVRTALQEQSK